MTRALREASQSVLLLGGQKDTVLDLAGIGDIVLTAYGKKSRNRTVGYRLGTGEKLDAVLASMNAVPESVTTLKAVQQLCKQKNLSLSLLQGLYCVLFENHSLQQLIS